MDHLIMSKGEFFRCIYDNVGATLYDITLLKIMLFEDLLVILFHMANKVQDFR